MVDFKKRLSKTATAKPIAPREIYDRLDRASDKGPLRPAQGSVLDEWLANRRDQRDVIFKLHTGVGKTLIGLLVLQSKLNEREGRALYLCPNNFLVQQTLAQAKQFGISAGPVDPDGELPVGFLDGKVILVTSVQKLFNGLTKFKLGPASEMVDWLVMDDSHACIDAIKDACMITLSNEHAAYTEIVDLFATDLESQGVGTFAEMRGRNSGAFLPVPYWAWVDHHRDVAAILAKYLDYRAIRFVWPLIRDILSNCLCVVSGRELVITPYLPPLELFGSFTRASHRVFMSATVTDDSFLIKGLRLAPEVVENPVVDPHEKWSGEKMVLIPSLVDHSLTDTEVVHAFAQPLPNRTIGVVALVPSFDDARDWEGEGAVLAKREDIDSRVEQLRNGVRDKTLVIANRYDGIDLPDDTCRILILDGKPYSEGLLDRYEETCRPTSEVLDTRTARVVEQGLGRAVRGEKDYCVVILSGADLVRAVRTKESRGYYSEQTRTQIELGIEISGMTAEDIAAGTAPMEALRKVIGQSLRRDDGWKEFYRERMDTISDPGATPRMLKVFAAELRAEEYFLAGNFDKAVGELQALLDAGRVQGEADRGWYLQEMARYRYSQDHAESNSLQRHAHNKNRHLLKPRNGVPVLKLAPIAQRRVAAIKDWIGLFETHQALSVAVEGIVSNLRFGVRAEPFERALDELGRALGFNTERPDREWKAGPDNLWALRDGVYLLWECKSEVETTRKEINKLETGQMNNSCAWFAREYPGARATRILVIPTKNVGTAAGFNEPVEIMRQRNLAKLTRAVREFFAAFQVLDLKDLSESKVQALLETHHLSSDALTSEYSEAPKIP